MEGKGKARAIDNKPATPRRTRVHEEALQPQGHFHQGAQRNPEENGIDRKTSQVMKDQMDLLEI